MKRQIIIILLVSLALSLFIQSCDNKPQTPAGTENVGNTPSTEITTVSDDTTDSSATELPTTSDNTDDSFGDLDTIPIPHSIEEIYNNSDLYPKFIKLRSILPQVENIEDYIDVVYYIDDIIEEYGVRYEIDDLFYVSVFYDENRGDKLFSEYNRLYGYEVHSDFLQSDYPDFYLVLQTVGDDEIMYTVSYGRISHIHFNASGLEFTFLIVPRTSINNSADLETMFSEYGELYSVINALTQGGAAREATLNTIKESIKNNMEYYNIETGNE